MSSTEPSSLLDEKHYPLEKPLIITSLDNAILVYYNAYLLDSDLSSGQHYPTFYNLLLEPGWWEGRNCKVPSTQNHI